MNIPVRSVDYLLPAHYEITSDQDMFVENKLPWRKWAYFAPLHNNLNDRLQSLQIAAWAHALLNMTSAPISGERNSDNLKITVSKRGYRYQIQVMARGQKTDDVIVTTKNAALMFISDFIK